MTDYRSGAAPCLTEVNRLPRLNPASRRRCCEASAPRGAGDDSGRFKLDLCGMIEEIRDEDHAHRGEVPAHEFPPYPPQLGSRQEIGRLVDAIGRHSTNVVGTATGLREHGKHVLQRLLELRDQLVAVKLLLFIPADLACDEPNPTGGNSDPVRITDGR